MKKVIFILLVVLTLGISANAQSIQWHQSYDNNQKFVADFFKATDNYNVFSYNEFTVTDNQALGYGIIYGEYRINKSHWMGHLESRFRVGDVDMVRMNPALYPLGGNMVNVGLAYELLIGNFCFNLTPMYRYDFGMSDPHNWQFSINSSADFKKVYYEGYLDTWGPDSFNLCTEQKVYYKITDNVNLGVNLMTYNIGDEWYFQPWLVGRLAF